MHRKIIILADRLNQYGGIERLTAVKANYWADQFGYQVHIVSLRDEKEQSAYRLSKKIQVTCLHIRFTQGKHLWYLPNLVQYVRNIVKVSRLLWKERPDFVLVASQILIFYCLPLIKGKSKIIKENHYSRAIDISDKKKRFLSIIERRYDYLVVLNREERTLYKSDNVVVIPNPIQLSEARPQNIARKENIAVAVLRFAPVKQLGKMVEAWEKFIKQRPDWTLHIYGDKSSLFFPPIETLVAAKGLSERILFKGVALNVHKVFEGAKVLLMTSANECFPMVILEAQANSVPVISFDSPTGPRNMIQNYANGIIVKLNDTEAFADALGAFADDETLQKKLSDNALLASKKYDIAVVMNLWQSLIFEVE